MAAESLDYSDFKTELTIKEKQNDHKKAVLKVDEYTVLKLHIADIDPLAPKTTEYVQGHLFAFFWIKMVNGSCLRMKC